MASVWEPARAASHSAVVPSAAEERTVRSIVQTKGNFVAVAAKSKPLLFLRALADAAPVHAAPAAPALPSTPEIRPRVRALRRRPLCRCFY